jgi:ABC-type antimicrobial peptide transport system permease subunit
LIAWFIGAIIGIPAAIGFVAMISNVLLPLDFAFTPLTLVWVLLGILMVATIACFGPALSASRQHITQILQYE